MADPPRLAQLRRRVLADPASIAFAALAEEYRRAQRLREAIEAARAGLAHHPTYATARVTLGRALLESGALDEARRELEQALAAAPENLTAIRALAELHREAGAPDHALALARRGVSLAPQDRDLRALLDALGPAPEPRPSGSSDARGLAALEPQPALPEPAAALPAPALVPLTRWLDALGRERLRRGHVPAGELTPAARH